MRKIIRKVKGQRAVDGAGVKLVRVLGNQTVNDFDPILMLDSFDSYNPNDYTAGFPMHPHRGIETITFLKEGTMKHKDSLGNEDTINSGEVQWMTAGSGILHEEQIPASERMLGVQIWLNMKSENKMNQPEYMKLSEENIPKIEIDGGYIRIISGTYKGNSGYESKYHPLKFYHIHLKKGNKFLVEENPGSSLMIFSLLGNITVNKEYIEEKTAVKLSEEGNLEFESIEEDCDILILGSDKIDEPVFWGGPIVMDTKEKLEKSFMELKNGDFIKERIDY